MRGRFVSSDMFDALELIKQVIDAMPEPTDAEDGWQLFKLYQARDCLRAAYDYEKDKEAELMEGFLLIDEADMLEEHYYGLSDWEIAVLMAVDDEPISRKRLQAVLDLWAHAEEGS